MRIVLAILLLTAIALSGCGSPPSNQSPVNRNTSGIVTLPPPLTPPGPVDTKFASCNPYFPLVPNSLVKYVLNYSSGLTGDVTVLVEQAPDENGRKVFIQKTQLYDVNTRGMEIIQNVERKFVCDGERIQVASEKTETKMQGKPDATSFEYRPESVYVMDPASLATPGTKWSYSLVTTMYPAGMPPVVSDRAVVVNREVKGEEEIQTQLGKFKAVKIEQIVDQNRISEYYVKGLGMVRRETAEGTRWEMKEYSGLQPLP